MEAPVGDCHHQNWSRSRIKELLARFQPEDRWNVDESALFAFAAPDRGLSRAQMSGERANKFRITLCFARNSDGSQKKHQ